MYICLMVVAKILPAKSANFNGVMYNEAKQENEKSALIEAKNFVGLDKINSTKEDFIRYFQAQSKKNSRVKLPQFHATISGKGKEMSFNELTDFANEYMEKMGYGDNPYLIYKHNDTDNNHLHIVSTRVDNNGLKINDSYERYKSQEIISEYFGLNHEKDLNKKLDSILEFNISTLSQYKLLLEKKELKFRANKDLSFSVYKGTFSKEISKEDIQKQIKSKKQFYKYDIIKKRKESIKSSLLEMTKNNPIEDLPFLAKNENFEVHLFKTKEEKKVFGYTIIDNKTKTIFKGSEILALKKLEEIKQNNGEIEQIKNIINAEFKNKPTTIKEINNFLEKEKNISLDFSGNIYKIDEKGEKKKQQNLKLPKEFIGKHFYKTRIDLANQFNVIKESDKIILAHLFKIDKSKIEVSKKNVEEIEKEISKRKNLNKFYNEVLNNFLKDETKTKEFLDTSKIEIYKKGENYFIADMEKSNVLTFNIDEKTAKKIEKLGLVSDIGKEKEISLNQGKDVSIIEDLSRIFDEGFEGESTNSKKKSKNKNNQRGI